MSLITGRVFRHSSLAGHITDRNVVPQQCYRFCLLYLFSSRQATFYFYLFLTCSIFFFFYSKQKEVSNPFQSPIIFFPSQLKRLSLYHVQVPGYHRGILMTGSCLRAWIVTICICCQGYHNKMPQTVAYTTEI